MHILLSPYQRPDSPRTPERDDRQHHKETEHADHVKESDAQRGTYFDFCHALHSTERTLKLIGLLFRGPVFAGERLRYEEPRMIAKFGPDSQQPVTFFNPDFPCFYAGLTGAASQEL